MSAQWSFVLADPTGLPLAELSTASGRAITFKRNSYAEVQLTISHEDDAAGLLLSTLANSGIPRLKGYRRGPNDPLSQAAPLRFRGYLAALQETSEETSLLTATFRSPFGVLVGDSSTAARYVQTPTTYTGVDAGAIAKALIDTTNLDALTGLATDPTLIQATVSRNCAYPVAQNIGTAITDLASLLDGFDFYETFAETGTVQHLPLPGAPTGLTANLHLGGPAWTGSGGLYYYMVTAVVGGIESGPSNEASLNLVIPGPQIDLAWTAVAGASSYKVYRALVSGGEMTSPALVASGISSNAYTDTGSAVSAGAVTALGTAWYPDAFFNVTASLGEINPAARFEYGPQTLSNVLSVSRQTTPPQNAILIVGSNGLQSSYVDTTSVAKYGKWWAYYSLTSVVDQATLDARARALVRSNPIKTITFIPELGLDSCPKPFDDWNLGDTVTFLANRVNLQENTQLRINGFTVPIDENGFETVSTNDPTSPEEDAVLHASFTASEVLNG